MTPATDQPFAPVRRLADRVRPVDREVVAVAAARHTALAKPPGSLGRLEALGARLSGISGGCPPPVPRRPVLVVAAGDHGVHARGVTRWPQEVTGLMVRTLRDGGAAASVLARQVGARLVVLDVGTGHRATADLSREDAMSPARAAESVLAGAEAASAACDAGADLLLTGEVGIANTTPAACLVAALTDADPDEVTGYGAANDEQTRWHKVEVVRAALERHRREHPALGAGRADEAATALASLGGAEHAALVGVILTGAARGVPVVLDGVVSVAAALVADAVAPAVRDRLVAGHRSVEPGASRGLQALGLDPVLDLGMRLGEGTGALLAVPVIRAAAAVLGEMATLDEVLGAG